MEPRHQRHNVGQGAGHTRGGKPPLFDRLCGDPDQGSPRAYSIAEVYLSVVRELRALLNTRQPVSPRPADNPGPETVITYGLPDFSSLNATSPADRQMLARLMERKIEAFEPRLRNVYVSFEPEAGVTALLGSSKPRSRPKPSGSQYPSGCCRPGTALP